LVAELGRYARLGRRLGGGGFGSHGAIVVVWVLRRQILGGASERGRPEGKFRSQGLLCDLIGEARAVMEMSPKDARAIEEVSASVHGVFGLN
jgi:hypothetical protein